MKALNHPLLLDENIHPAVGKALTERGFDVETVSSLGMQGEPDTKVLQVALAAQRVVVTHDSDFGTLAVRTGRHLIGIVYLRPGHINPDVVLKMLDAVNEMAVFPSPPFIVVAVRKSGGIRVRMREIQTISQSSSDGP